MGCISCKHTEETINSSPHTSKKESGWRFVAGIKAKGLEFNVQLRLVNSKLSYYRSKDLQPINSNNSNYYKNPSIIKGFHILFVF